MESDPSDVGMAASGCGWSVRASRESHHCINPVRTCEEDVFTEALKLRNKDKPLIKLSIGDPSVFGNLPPPPEAYEGVKRAVDSCQYNGYGHSSGIPVAREAIVKEYSTPEAPFTADDVIMTHSASGALLLSLEVLCEPGSSILVPSPGFSLYKCHAQARGVAIKLYKLLPERDWEIDLEDLESQIDVTTSAIVFNSPSNPCGCVYSDTHQRDLLTIAHRHKIPIIADDVYQGMVFPGQSYTPIASLSKNVPILSCGALSKRYMVPGWRLGWIIIHDRNNSFSKEIAPGLARLARKLLGPCSLVQAALPHIFTTPQSYHERTVSVIHHNAQLVYEQLQKAPGLTPVMPAGAMYMMVNIDMASYPGMSSDTDFTKQLLIEECVFCLPGQAFLSSQCFRVVLMMPDPELLQAMERIIAFCSRHYKADS